MGYSSSEFVYRHKVVDGWLVGSLKCHLRPVYQGMDPEYALHLLKLLYEISMDRNQGAHHRTDLFKYLVATPPIFHACKQLEEDSFGDRSDFILLFGPLLANFYHLQIGKQKERHNKAESEMTKKLKGASTGAGAKADAKADARAADKEAKPTANVTDSLKKLLEKIRIERNREDAEISDGDEEEDDGDAQDYGATARIDHEPLQPRNEDLTGLAETAWILTEVLHPYNQLELRGEDSDKSNKMNYNRLRHVFEMLNAAWLILKEDLLGELAKEPTGAEAFAYAPHRRLVDLLQRISELYVQPFREWVVHGNAVPFIENFHNMWFMAAHYGRYKICRAYLLYYNSLTTLLNRPEHLRVLLRNTDVFNEIYIEFFGALVGAAMPTNGTVDGDTVKNAADGALPATDCRRPPRDGPCRQFARRNLREGGTLLRLRPHQ